ncbi:AMP-binding protein, partial [Candidatus Sumerlaeota bacterium]|nr:AMP-binding protein [Candidatus Sumerlaeota bacterium]
MNQEQVNVAAYLPEMARRHPDMRAVVLPQGGGSNGSVRYREVSFRELNELSDRYARGLERAGIRRGIRTALMVTPGLEFFGLTFALFKIGAVVVMIDPGIGIKNIGKCLAEAEPEAFIGIPKAHVARVLFRWASKSLKTLVTVGPRLFWGGNNLDALTRNEPAEYTMAGTS